MSDRAEDLIHRFGRRYVAALALVAALLILDQAVLQPLLVHLNVHAPVINLAGRQRMLSQRLAKAALAISLRPEESPAWVGELETSLADWTRVHRGLQAGDAELHLPGTSDEGLEASFRTIEPHFAALADSVRRVMNDPGEARAAAAGMLEHEREYVRIMDGIVQQFEGESREQVARLRLVAMGVTASVLSLMAAMYALVLRPAFRLIRTQVHLLTESEADLRDARDRLEVRVAERTVELSRVNAELAQEIEDRREAQERNLELQSQLAHAARVTSLGELATGIAHEINQPLGTITNYAETLDLLASSPSPPAPEIRALSTKVRDAALRAGQIIARMRRFVRSRTTTHSPELLNSLISEVVELCHPELRDHQVEVDVRLAATSGCLVNVDSIQIQQVLVNLVRNAIQSMDNDPPSDRQLTIATALTSESVIVEVDDNGPGFPHGHAEKLTGSVVSPFRSSKPDGLGMGLSICQAILRAHQGSLAADNRTPRGARLSFKLPRAGAPAGESGSDSVSRTHVPLAPAATGHADSLRGG